MMKLTLGFVAVLASVDAHKNYTGYIVSDSQVHVCLYIFDRHQCFMSTGRHASSGQRSVRWVQQPEPELGGSPDEARDDTLQRYS